jgi:hypothetical protein
MNDIFNIHPSVPSIPCSSIDCKSMSSFSCPCTDLLYCVECTTILHSSCNASLLYPKSYVIKTLVTIRKRLVQIHEFAKVYGMQQLGIGAEEEFEAMKISLEKLKEELNTAKEGQIMGIFEKAME